MGNRTALENYRLKEKQTQTCTEDTVVEEYKLPNGKTKTRERKVTNCTEDVTVVEKQLNTLEFTTNELNQYEKLENKNKNGELKKEFYYKYDLNGNLQEDDINMYFYDYKNRLVKVVKKEIIETTETGVIITIKPEKEIVRYSYDTLGRRTKKIKPNLTTTYYYANNNAIQEQTRTNDGILKETRINIYSNKTDDILATYITNHTTNTTYKYFYEKDHLGSITKITDTVGNTVEQYEYDAFGTAYIRKDANTSTGELETTLSLTEVEGSETDTTGEGEELTMNGIKYKRYNGKGLINNTRLYTGREYEKELKLYYNRARYYNPQLGRFISRDPIDISDDVNLYTYVGNNPVNYTDPMGLSSKSAIKKYEYPWMYDTAVALENIMGAPLSSIGIDPTTVASFIGLNASMIGGDRVNLNISSYMLAKFMYGNGGSESYDNNHWISQRVKYTNFYNKQKQRIEEVLKNANVGAEKSLSLFDGDGVGTISERFDFGTSFGSIQGTISGIKNEDGTITTTFYIKDEYKYYYKDRIGDTITNPFNSMGKYYQDKGYGTPFMWELNITETFKN